MAHFARLDDNNQVVEVIVVSNDIATDEEAGIAFLIEWSGGYDNWKQTSYNGSIRKNFAGIGYSYDPALDAFIPPRPHHSFTLDEATCIWINPNQDSLQ